MTKTVPTDTGEPTGYGATAAELRRIADALDTLPGAPSHVSIDVQTTPDKGTNEEIAAGVDAVAMAVLGRPGKDRDLSGGGSQRNVSDWTRQSDGQSFNVSIYQMYVKPDPKDAEIERLRAELAEARAKASPEPYVEYLRSVDNGGTSAEVPTGVEGGPVTGRATGGE